MGTFKVSKMRYIVTVAFVLTLFATAVNAHFSLNFPPPRGTFNAANEVNFCGNITFRNERANYMYADICVADGYTTPAANRTQFPLSDGYITLRTGHPHWTCTSDFQIITPCTDLYSDIDYQAGVLFSTAQNPTAWENFTLVTGYSSTQLPGNYCLPLDFSKSSAASGLQAGQNITIQVRT